MRPTPAKRHHHQRHQEESEPSVELLKAVAQAWHAQSGNPKPTDEFHARLHSYAHRRPSRFKLEAVALAAADANWDFAQSLWDSYEIVMLSKKLEDVDLETDRKHGLISV
ncbi:hypothetical protein ZIOFF_021025 [Zingiber officinale]|uniref:Uncharacterized protein n=1 Tax=Zingiber officinale TaxID=94328 RepID=A0A8J5H1B1_ZINOF|nr:hypothetical protein ZIOFF_021025 [Zingiber officinale]